MKKNWMRLAAALLLCAMLLGLIGCGSRSGGADSIEDVITQLETACRQMDVEAALDCIVPSVSGPMHSMLKLATAASETSEDALLRKLISQYGGTSVSEDELEAACESLTLEIESTTPLDDAITEVEIVASTTVGATNYSQRMTFTMVCQSGRWYISEARPD